MSRWLGFLYGLFCYALSLLSILYAIGFVSNRFVPKSIDSGAQSGLARSLATDLLLLGLFAAQHTVMARPTFKRWWTKYVPRHLERSTFVLAASLTFLLLFRFWRPMPAVVWSTESRTLAAILGNLSRAGWFTALASTFMINHFDLFGLRQVGLHLLGREYRPVEFRTNYLYRFVRHPIMLGFLVAFWATPRMTVGHLLFATAITVYVLIGIRLEERDLLHFLGEEYETYRRRVPMLIPFTKRHGR